MVFSRKRSGNFSAGDLLVYRRVTLEHIQMDLHPLLHLHLFIAWEFKSTPPGCHSPQEIMPAIKGFLTPIRPYLRPATSWGGNVGFTGLVPFDFLRFISWLFLSESCQLAPKVIRPWTSVGWVHPQGSKKVPIPPKRRDFCTFLGTQNPDGRNVCWSFERKGSYV